MGVQDPSAGHEVQLLDVIPELRGTRPVLRVEGRETWAAGCRAQLQGVRPRLRGTRPGCEERDPTVEHKTWATQHEIQATRLKIGVTGCKTWCWAQDPGCGT